MLYHHCAGCGAIYATPQTNRYCSECQKADKKTRVPGGITELNRVTDRRKERLRNLYLQDVEQWRRQCRRYNSK